MALLSAGRPETQQADSSMTAALWPLLLGKQAPPFARLLDPFCDDGLHMHTSLKAARRAAGLPLPKADGSFSRLYAMAMQARLILAARDAMRQAEAAAAAKYRHVEAAPGGARRRWLPWRRRPQQQAAVSSEPGGGRTPQWRLGNGLPPGFGTTQSFALGTAIMLMKSQPGHAFLVPDEQQVCTDFRCFDGPKITTQRSERRRLLP